jgi:hypothetical protein
MVFWAVVSDSTEEAMELLTSREEAEVVVQYFRDPAGKVLEIAEGDMWPP